MQGIIIADTLPYFPHLIFTYDPFGLYLQYFSYAFVLPCTNVFTMETPVDMHPFTPVPLVEIYGQVLTFTPVISLETTVLSVEISMHVLLLVSLLVLQCVCLSVHLLPRASVHVLMGASVLPVAVLYVCMTFCPTVQFPLCTILT